MLKWQQEIRNQIGDESMPGWFSFPKKRAAASAQDQPEKVLEFGLTGVPTSWVKIIKLPTGSAPEWVRQKWVGLTLPEATLSQWDRDFNGMFGRGGDLESGDQSVYIPYRTAMEILALKSPAAADWWSTNFPGQLINKQDICFNFQKSEVEHVNN